MLSRLLPRQTNFFDFFEQAAALSVQGARALGELSKESADFDSIAARIKGLEHDADEVTHTCMETLHKTFITPIDRNDIHRLASKLDDIMDFIDAAARLMTLFEITEVPENRGRGRRCAAQGHRGGGACGEGAAQHAQPDRHSR